MIDDQNRSPEGVYVSGEYPESRNKIEKLLSNYVNSSQVGLCILDADLRFLAVNKALADMNRVPAQEHLGRTVREILHEAADPIEQKIREVLDRQEPAQLELSAMLPLGTELRHWL